MMQLNWIKCGARSNERFCPLETVVLDNVDTMGVYIIWHNLSSKVIYVGQGNVKERLTEHRGDTNILSHRGNGLLLVTWASVPDEADRLGIERYLSGRYTPLLGQHYGTTPAIPVNPPS